MELVGFCVALGYPCHGAKHRNGILKAHLAVHRWRGCSYMASADFFFVLENLVVKDFKIRYRNMSLGIAWSLINPLVMMGVLVLVFTFVFPDRSRHAFPVFILCGLVPFNFFTIAWSSGMTCVVENAGMVKRVPMPRILLPLASVLSNCVQMFFQIALLLVFDLAFGFGVNRYWIWLPVVWIFEILFVTGVVMASCALDVYVRDLRYVVDSIIRLIFWMVPIFYTVENVPIPYRGVYEFNPIAALIHALRRILMEAAAPPADVLWKLSITSVVALLAGWLIFRRLQPDFYNHL
jgi:lipopolysaccharide transport system permease protein